MYLSNAQKNSLTAAVVNGHLHRSTKPILVGDADKQVMYCAFLERSQILFRLQQQVIAGAWLQAHETGLRVDQYLQLIALL